MTTPDRERFLGGLVSDEAEQLYARLVDVGWLEIGPGADQVALDNAAVRELTDARVAYHSHLQTDRLEAVTQPTALQLLLTHHHEKIVKHQQAAISGWRTLDSILSVTLERTIHTGDPQHHLVEVVSNRAELHRISIELYEGTTKELLGFSTGTFTTPMNENTLLAPAPPSLAKGAQFRMIYDGKYSADRVGARIIEASVAAGEQARVRNHLPLKMLHVDDRIALVALTSTGVGGSLLVRSPQLLEGLRQWFELLWADPGSTRVGDPDQIALNAAQRNVLRLLSAGMSDEAIARASGASVRTVRRHISAIMEMLGVPSRFAAGVAAAKRGWNLMSERPSGGPSDGPGPLAGLVSPAAERLYWRLVTAGPLRIGTAPDEVDTDSGACRELSDADLLYADHDHADHIRAVSTTIALTLLLSRRQQQLVETHMTVIRGWSVLESLLRPADGRSPERECSDSKTVEILRDGHAITALSADLYMSARQELCTTTTGSYVTPLADHQILTPPKSSLTNGTRFRNIYDGAFASSPVGARIIELSRQGGEEARVRATLPTKMLLVDRRIAMVALNDTGMGAAAVVRSPQLLALLHEWFDLVWEDAGTASTVPAHGSPLNQSQRRVIRLLATGLTDDAIARAADMSVRTVRRHITSIMEALGTSTRFATGVAATKRGWI